MFQDTSRSDWNETIPVDFLRINFNPSMDNNHMLCKVQNEITYSFPNFTTLLKFVDG